MHITECRMCKGSDFELILDLGFHPPSDSFLTSQELDEPETTYPLRTVICKGCGLWQLDYVVDQKILYQKNYPYESSTTKTGRMHYHGMAAAIFDSFQIPKGSLAIDIGSNIGVLLEGFKIKGMNVLGVDPATNIAVKANAAGIETIPDFFSARVAREIKNTKGEAAVITGTNVFAHIHDLDDIMEGAKHLLSPKGVFVVEAPYLAELVKNTEYDTIYHEHLSYLSVKPLARFFDRLGLELFDVHMQDIHGGTMRFFVSRKGAYQKRPIVAGLAGLEEREHIYDTAVMKETFIPKILTQRRDLLFLIHDLKRKGKRVVGVSAPAKGNTLLNYCALKSDMLDYITEKAQIKLGLYTPGTHIKIEPDSKLFEDQPDYALILAWNFAKEIMENLAEYKKRGGKFIIPIPEPKII